MEQLAAACKECKPIYSLSYISFPTPDSPVRLDSNDEIFVRFRVAHEEESYSYPTGAGGLKDFIGCEAKGEQPKLLYTFPYSGHIVFFARLPNREVRPELNNDVRTGRVKLRVDLDGEMFEISPSAITIPWGGISFNKSRQIR